VHHTSQNAYNGLAAMYILHDEHELGLGIPQGRYDVPVVIRDAMFDSKGGLVYDDNSESGVYGDVILINGVPWPEMVVEPRKYRFRFLNASVSRS
jgi:spore coat protein A, manganese oxidase